MFFRSSQKKGDVCLVLDIGNASLAGSLVSFTPGFLPEALYTVRLPLNVSDHAHPEKLQSILSSQLDLVLRAISETGFTHDYFKDHEKKITKALCVFASPWFASRTKHVVISNEKPFFITKDFLEDVLKKEVDLFEKELASGSHGEEFKDGVVVMEKTIADAKVNGYSIENPLGQKTNVCDVTMYLGIGSKELTTRIAGQISKFFHVSDRDLMWHSFPLVAHTALHKIYPHEKNYVLCDITGEVTDLTLVINGTIGQTVSFPSGKFFLIRKLAQVMQVPPEVAQSFLHLWQSNAADAESAQKMQEALVDAEHEWSIYFEDALSSLGKVNTLPQKVFLTVDTDVAALFVEFFKTPKTDLTASWRRGVSVVHMSEDLLKNFYKSPQSFVFDECVALESVFLSVFE